jgi:hypothetical protein
MIQAAIFMGVFCFRNAIFVVLQKINPALPKLKINYKHPPR